MTDENVKSSDKAVIEELLKAIETLLGSKNITNWEARDLGKIETKTPALLKKIKETTKEIQRITDEMKKYDAATVKSSDKESIEKLMEAMDVLLKTENLTADEITDLGNMKTTAKGLLTKIADTAKEITRITDEVKKYDQKTVKSSDKKDIDELIANINTLLATDNLTADEITGLGNVKTTAENLLTKIAATAEEITRITEEVKKYDPATVKSSDKQALDELVKALEKLLGTENLTKEEKTALGKVKTTAEGLLTKIADTADEIKRITDGINGITLDKVKSSDKKDIDELIKDLEKLLGTDNLTEEEKAALGDVKTTAEGLLTKIADTAKEMERIAEEIKKYDPATVKSSDKKDLEKLLADVNTILKTDNLTTEEITKINAGKAALNELLNKVQTTDEKIKRLEKEITGYDKKTVTSADKAVIDALISEIDELLKTGNITEEEKAALNKTKDTANDLLGQIKAAGDALKKALVEKPAITDKNVKITDKASLNTEKTEIEKVLKDYDGNLTDTEKKALNTRLDVVNSALERIKKAENVQKLIDALADPGKTTKSDENAILAAKKAYEALTDYEKSMVNKSKLDKAAKALESVKKSNSPKTDDSSNLLLWYSLLFASGAAATIFGVNKKRKNQKSH